MSWSRDMYDLFKAYQAATDSSQLHRQAIGKSLREWTDGKGGNLTMALDKALSRTELDIQSGLINDSEIAFRYSLMFMIAMLTERADYVSRTHMMEFTSVLQKMIE